MSTKKIIREAEAEIEETLQFLQDEHGVRPFRLLCEVDEVDGEIEVTIIKDERYK